MTKNFTANVIFSSTFLDYPDNSSHAVIAYLMGCNNNCKNCHNYRFKDRVIYDDEVKTYNVYDFCKEVRKRLSANRTNKLVLSGGDPLSSFNLDFTRELLNNKPFCDSCDICIYTGHDIEYVRENIPFGTFKFVKCGQYFDNLSKKPSKTLEKFVLASSNQNFYDNRFELLSDSGVLRFNS
jgi:organic radical activating enzyme